MRRCATRMREGRRGESQNVYGRPSGVCFSLGIKPTMKSGMLLNTCDLRNHFLSSLPAAITHAARSASSRLSCSLLTADSADAEVRSPKLPYAASEELKAPSPHVDRPFTHGGDPYPVSRSTADDSASYDHHCPQALSGTSSTELSRAPRAVRSGCLRLVVPRPGNSATGVATSIHDDHSSRSSSTHSKSLLDISTSRSSV